MGGHEPCEEYYMRMPDESVKLRALPYVLIPPLLLSPFLTPFSLTLSIPFHLSFASLFYHFSISSSPRHTYTISFQNPVLPSLIPLSSPIFLSTLPLSLLLSFSFLIASPFHPLIHFI